ncbi:alpha/beta hydrolase [uncultured Thiothrix sp.]|uniref:alpha/beta fold hydrolase n=1 Tax=uncultured Thiothrix sp. TaxID=223185 RepID=UPI00261F7225|nr:alpha/beta hydrolase [uncultured Thiothrix sp.]
MSIGYTTIGQGTEHVLVFHGWFGDYTAWEPTLKALDTDTFTYVFIDYRGYGKSAALTGDYSMREIAADATAVVRELQLKSLHVIGHSMGGMAMQRFILDCDADIQVKSAVGVTPVPACGGQLDENAWGLFAGAIQQDANRYTIINFTTGNRLTPTWINRIVQASRATTNEAAFAGYLNAWVKENFADEISRIQTPMLVCVGENDGASNAEAMKATYLTWYPSCELQVIPNAGHYPMQETPIDLITRLEGFMRNYS